MAGFGSRSSAVMLSGGSDLGTDLVV
jgi:hypothetical protein